MAGELLAASCQFNREMGVNLHKGWQLALSPHCTFGSANGILLLIVYVCGKGIF